MSVKLKKIDAIIVVALIVVAGIFLYRAGYISLPIFEAEDTPEDDENVTSPPPKIPTNTLRYPFRPGVFTYVPGKCALAAISVLWDVNRSWHGRYLGPVSVNRSQVVCQEEKPDDGNCCNWRRIGPINWLTIV